MGVFHCRALAVLCKVCNFLSLSGVKGVSLLSASPSRQPETVVGEVLISSGCQCVRCVFSLIFTSQVTRNFSPPSHKGYIIF